MGKNLVPTRQIVIEDVTLRHTHSSDISLPNWVFAGGDGEVRDIWEVAVTHRHGRLPSSRHDYFFATENEAKEFAEKILKNGCMFNDASMSYIQKKRMVRLIIDGFAGGKCPSPKITRSSLPTAITMKAGLSQGEGQPSAEILENLGATRVEQLQSEFGEVWWAAAEFEYCQINLPYSSLAFIASGYHFYLFVAENYFQAGYLLRDLEQLATSVEQDAVHLEKMRDSAKKKSGDSSTRLRSKRRQSLLKAIEQVAHRNPDVVGLGEKQVLKLALPIAKSADPRLWGQGSGQVEEYLAEIRRGEAGKRVKARYEAIFQRPTA
ncbi:hypothetical protein GGQ68_000729 [Sagittula marina]|uniref:Uncharacterized protein n=1 Tax=Sagittula marina TaxID=943940 RepID=A0A7W6DJX5_9RHOB|nr:hypothetical protein [Sagittula marina]MBB3984413.1 hypothetical protein [Sagittula marina]